MSWHNSATAAIIESFGLSHCPTSNALLPSWCERMNAIVIVDIQNYGVIDFAIS